VKSCCLGNLLGLIFATRPSRFADGLVARTLVNGSGRLFIPHLTRCFRAQNAITPWMSLFSSGGNSGTGNTHQLTFADFYSEDISFLLTIAWPRAKLSLAPAGSPKKKESTDRARQILALLVFVANRCSLPNQPILFLRKGGASAFILVKIARKLEKILAKAAV